MGRIPVRQSDANLRETVPGRKTANVLPLRPAQPVDDLWLAKCRIAKALILIYCEKRLYEGLDILCEIVGWGSLRDPFASVEEVNEWLRRMIPNPPLPLKTRPETPVQSNAMVLAVGKKCPGCNRLILSLAPKVRKDRLPTCATCGRRFNKKR